MLIDVHCHADLYLDLDMVIEEAKQVGVKKVISVGMSARGLERILEISNRYDIIYPSLGIHPEEVQENRNIEVELDSVIELIRKIKKKFVRLQKLG